MLTKKGTNIILYGNDGLFTEQLLYNLNKV